MNKKILRCQVGTSSKEERMIIEICKRCSGEGSVLDNEYRDRNQIKCVQCQGSGKIVVMGYKISIPFRDRNNRKVLDADEQIINILKRVHNDY